MILTAENDYGKMVQEFAYHVNKEIPFIKLLKVVKNYDVEYDLNTTVFEFENFEKGLKVFTQQHDTNELSKEDMEFYNNLKYVTIKEGENGEGIKYIDLDSVKIYKKYISNKFEEELAPYLKGIKNYKINVRYGLKWIIGIDLIIDN